MKSMKNLKFWSLLIGLVFGSLAFVACGDDDDDNSNNPTPTPTPPTNILLGKWSKSTVIPGGENQTQGKYYAVVTNSYEFKSDMTFESSTSSVTIYEKADPAEQFSRTTGTYTFENNQLTLNYQKFEFWNWNEEKWTSHGNVQPYTVQYRVTTTDNSITFTNDTEAITITKHDVYINKVLGTWEYDYDDGVNVKEQWQITQNSITRVYTYYLSEELVGAGVTGTYEIALVKNTKGQQAFNCHFDHFMKCIDASKLQFEVGEETGRGGQDYVVPFNYDSDKDKLTINFNGKIRTLKRK